MKIILTVAVLASSAVFAEVPPDVAKQLINIGRGVCVPETRIRYSGRV